jgi:hypothetical protein
VVALGIAVAATFIPLAYGVSTDVLSSKIELARMRPQLDALQAQQASEKEALDRLQIDEPARHDRASLNDPTGAR